MTLEILGGQKKGLCLECRRNNQDLLHYKVDGEEEVWLCTECSINCIAGKPLKILDKLRKKQREQIVAGRTLHTHGPDLTCFPDCPGFVAALYNIKNIETGIPGVEQQTISPKLIPVFCPVCNKVKFISSLYGFVEYQRMLAKYSMETAGKEREEVKIILQQQSGTLSVTLTEKNLLKIYLDEGYLSFPCPPCQAEISAEMYRQNGLDCVAIGMNVVGREMIEKHPDKVKELRASQGSSWVD